MSLESSSLFKSPHNPQLSQSRMRWVEWLIAVLFVITLLIGSGIFIEASNAADVKIKNHNELILNPHAVVPGTMRNYDVSQDQDISQNQVVHKKYQSLANNSSYEVEDNSCELKP